MPKPNDELLWKSPVITLTQEEVDEMNNLAAENKIPRDWYDRYLAASEKQVFGHDVKHDRHGEPLEQGIGSAAHPTRNSIDAYKGHQLGNRFGPEPDFQKNLDKMEADLAEFESKQAAKRASAKAKRQKAA